jgi:hypothetical protein
MQYFEVITWDFSGGVDGNHKNTSVSVAVTDAETRNGNFPNIS